MTNSDQSTLHALSENQAARYIGVSPAVMRLWRAKGEGPRHFRAGSKLIRYRTRDLNEWVEARLSKPTEVEAR
jgi:predicted DNA-binding transcriptional regulator AlpA